MTPSDTPPATRAKAIGAILAVFALGLICGLFGGIRLAHYKVEKALSRGPDGVAESLAAKISKDLRLDQAQRAAVSAIVTARLAELQQVRRQIAPAAEAVIARGESEIRALLRPDQIPAFDKFRDRAKERWAPPPFTPPHPAGGQP